MTQGFESEGRFRIKPATVDDVGLVLDFVKGLADYEQMADEVAATDLPPGRRGIRESG